MAQLGSAMPARQLHDAQREPDEGRGRPRRRAADERGSAWERSSSVVEPTARPQREHVSAYLDESSVVRVTRRSDRRGQARTARADASAAQYRRDERRPSGFTLVPEAPAREPERQERRSHREREDARRWDDAPRSRATYADDYDDYYVDEGISGYQSRRAAVAAALRAIPEAIGSAILGALARVRLRGVVVLAVIALTIAALFNPVRDLYLANRRLDTLQEYYDALLAQNDEIRHELEVLQTREGIENEARARGYVEPGETKVVVEGLPESEYQGAAAYAITDIELPDNRPWYVRVLDELFGYDPEA